MRFRSGPVGFGRVWGHNEPTPLTASKALRLYADNFGGGVQRDGSIVNCQRQRGKAFGHLNKNVRLRWRMIRKPAQRSKRALAATAAGLAGALPCCGGGSCQLRDRRPCAFEHRELWSIRPKSCRMREVNTLQEADTGYAPGLGQASLVPTCSPEIMPLASSLVRCIELLPDLGPPGRSVELRQRQKATVSILPKPRHSTPIVGRIRHGDFSRHGAGSGLHLTPFRDHPPRLAKAQPEGLLRYPQRRTCDAERPGRSASPRLAR